MEFLSWKVEDDVAIVTIARPPANALSVRLIVEVNELLDAVENDDAVRVIVFMARDVSSQQVQTLRSLQVLKLAKSLQSYQVMDK